MLVIAWWATPNNTSTTATGSDRGGPATTSRMSSPVLLAQSTWGAMACSMVGACASAGRTPSTVRLVSVSALSAGLDGGDIGTRCVSVLASADSRRVDNGAADRLVAGCTFSVSATSIGATSLGATSFGATSFGATSLGATSISTTVSQVQHH